MSSQTIDNLKISLRWSPQDKDGDWFDRNGVSTLFYAVAQNDELLVRELLSHLDRNESIDTLQRKKQLISELPEHGFVEVGESFGEHIFSVCFTPTTHCTTCKPPQALLEKEPFSQRRCSWGLHRSCAYS